MIQQPVIPLAAIQQNEESKDSRSNTVIKRGHLAFVTADTYKAATLNKLLPPGFRIEIVETLQRNYENRLAQ